jgi:hypothetical protein
MQKRRTNPPLKDSRERVRPQLPEWDTYPVYVEDLATVTPLDIPRGATLEIHLGEGRRIQIETLDRNGDRTLTIRGEGTLVVHPESSTSFRVALETPIERHRRVTAPHTP